jgi:hypothetical protein
VVSMKGRTATNTTFFVYYFISKSPFTSRDSKVKVNIGDEVDDIIKSIKKENRNILDSVDAAQIGLFMSAADNEDALLLPWKEWDPNVKWGTKRDPVIADTNLYPSSYKTPGNEKGLSGNEKQSFHVYYRVSIDDKLSQRAKIWVNIGDDVDDMKNLIKMETSNTFASIDAIQIKISCKISEMGSQRQTITTPLIVKSSRGSFIEREIESVRSNVGATVTPLNQVRTSNGMTEPESAVAKSDGELELQGTEEEEDDEDYQLQDTEEEEDDEDFHSGEVDQISPLKSDSELELQDTEEEDEDCNSDGVDSRVPVIDGPTLIIVERAGIPAVDGTYKRDGILDSCARYVEEDEDCNSDGVDSRVPVIDGPTHIIVERAGIPAVDGTYKRDGILDSCARYVEEDEDCNSDGVDSRVPVIDGPTHIIVERAGIPAVDGTYKRDGILDSCARCVRNGLWKNKRCVFEISVYAETESKKDWFISMLGAIPDDEDTLFISHPCRTKAI